MSLSVTGGAGFIGSHVVGKLLERGIQIFVYDLPGMGHQLLDNLAVFIPGSILDLESLWVTMVCKDAVYHLAAIAAVKDVLEDPYFKLGPAWPVCGAGSSGCGAGWLGNLSDLSREALA